MKTVSLSEFRKNARATLEKVAGGQGFILTRRGRAIARLEPICDERIGPDEPIYALADHAVEGDSMTSEQMDREIYGR